MSPKLRPTDLAEYNRKNRQYWDEAVAIHVASSFYRVDAFRAGECVLHDVDVTQVGNVVGKRLIHLQCHFGLETLSWARRGAVVTGIDYSAKAIQTAKSMAQDTGIAGEFIESDVYKTCDVVTGKYDVVYTGSGALCWLPNIREWAEVVSALLKPGGLFYIREAHPMLMTLADDRPDDQLLVENSYFEMSAPYVDDSEADYADPYATLSSGPTYQWNHGLGETITALIEAGMNIETVNEHQEAPWKPLPDMVEDKPRIWKLAEKRERLPLMYSIRATRR